jgi:hypothetical protein
VIRHSGARRAAVTARLHDGRLELVISDDGHGRAASGTATSGAGLIGMQERTTMLGGESAPATATAALSYMRGYPQGWTGNQDRARRRPGGRPRRTAHTG